ncbi:hypothetical protein [Rhodanobacter lindaniclasticus]
MSSINQKVVIWASGKVGRTVGKGECWDLAELALKHAGAKTSADLGPVGDDTNYVWGDSIDIKDVVAGDVLQFRDYEESTVTETTYEFSDGSSDTSTGTATEEREHHTAIANGEPDAQGALRIFEQNAAPHGKVVQHWRIHTRTVAPVVTHTVERRTNPSSKKPETVKVTKTVTVTVSGTIWAYRPKS